jgi:hypothetical protein
MTFFCPNLSDICPIVIVDIKNPMKNIAAIRLATQKAHNGAPEIR